MDDEQKYPCLKIKFKIVPGQVGVRPDKIVKKWLEENPAKKARMLREKRCDELRGSLEWGQGGSLLRILL